MEQVVWGADLSSLYQPNISAAGVEKVFVLDGQQREVDHVCPVGKPLPGGFPLRSILEYFKRRGQQVKLHREDLHISRLRALWLNLVYVQQQGHSAFDVQLKDNGPQVNPIFPCSPLKTRLAVLPVSNRSASIFIAISCSRIPGNGYFDVPGYLRFRDRRFERIWEIVSATVDLENRAWLPGV